MRLVNLDEYEATAETGKTAVAKAMAKYERKNPLTEFSLPLDKYDIVLHPKENRINFRRKDGSFS